MQTHTRRALVSAILSKDTRYCKSGLRIAILTRTPGQTNGPMAFYRVLRRFRRALELGNKGGVHHHPRCPVEERY